MKKGTLRTIIKSIVVILYLLLSTYLCITLYSLEVLPVKYIILISSLIFVLDLVADIFIFQKKKVFKIIAGILYILITIICFIGIKYGSSTINFFDTAFNNIEKEITTYDVIVLSSSEINDIKELDNNILGYLDNDSNLDKCKETIAKKVELNYYPYQDLNELYISLTDQTTQAILLDDSYISVLEETYETIEDDIKIIYTFDIESEVNTSKDEVTELKPINIYLSGSDSRSDVIYNKSLSDVNIIITINPNTNEILTTNIPRDYYVQLAGETGLKDKLTHAGVQGLAESTETVANIFDIDIDYSVKVGFTALVKIVDLIGGVDVYSDTSFDSFHIKGWHVNKGYVHLDGEHALAYARERYAYSTGDRHRGQNQQDVLEAIIKKITTNKSLLLKYDDLLDDFKDLYITNIPSSYVKLLLKYELNEMPSWNITNQSVSGSDGYTVTHLYPNTKTYVMIPYEKDISNAREKILQTLYNN